MDEFNLKPCPFCGTSVKWLHNIDGEPDGLRCPGCHCYFSFPRIKVNGNHEPFGVAMGKMAEIWNRRQERFGGV